MYKKHWRMTLTAALGGTGAQGLEMAQINISLGKNVNDQSVWPQFLEPTDPVWTDLADDCKAFWADPRTAISSLARLHSVKFAEIGEDGRYTTAPVIKDFTAVNGGGANIGTPWQAAVAVTLMTDNQLSRVKGRFYLPVPSINVGTDGLMTELERDGIEASAAEFLSNVANQPGIDVLDIGPVIASQGRQSPPAPPANYTVTHVRVGRALDTIRSRRSHLDELPGDPTALNI